MPKVRGTARTCENPVAAMILGELGRRRKRADRRRQVRIGALVLRDEPADERQQVAEIPARTACGSRECAAGRTRGWRAGRRASGRARSPRARAPARRRCGCRSRSWRRRTIASRDRDARRVAAHQPDRAARADAPRTFASAEPQHLAGEIDADDRRAGRARARPRSRGRRCRCTGRARARPAASAQRVDRAVAPAPIEAGAEHVIEQVVARRDRVEHRRRCARASCRR